MPSSSNLPVPKPAEPIYRQSFDSWNSSSTGHQRAENRLAASTGWRESRNQKLMSQFTGGAGGGRRVSDTVGAGSKSWDPAARALITPEARSRARSSVLDMLANPGTMKLPSSSPMSRLVVSNSSSAASVPHKGTLGSLSANGLVAEEHPMTKEDEDEDAAREQAKQACGIFDGVVIYLNGSTHPLISDHRLKHVLGEHGGRMSSHLGRRKVTHVILGRPAGAGYGSGGGLAGGKLQREIAKTGGAAVKYVGVEWVLESIKAGKRLPEARFAHLKMASKGQQSVYGLYSTHREKTPAGVDESQPPPSGQAVR